VQHVGRVDVFQAAERLVDERLEVRVRERLARADLSVMESRSCSIAMKDQKDCYDARSRGGRLP
jgi:hypothetical protein